MKKWKAVLSGEGGQGVQAMAETLALAAYRSGLKALYIPNFGIEQRGGVSLAMIQISEQPIGAPKFITADFITALSKRALERSERYFGSNTIILYDNSLIEPPAVSDRVVGLQSYETVAPEGFVKRNAGGDANQNDGSDGFQCNRLVAIPASDLARKRLHPRVFNMIILGAIIGITGVVELDAVKQALEEKLGQRFKTDPSLKDYNFRALDLGLKQVRAYRDGNVILGKG